MAEKSPCNPEVERMTLGACLHSGDAVVEVLGALDGGDFFTRTNQVIFEGVRYLAELGMSIDRVTLADYFQSRNQLDLVGGVTGLVSLDEDMPRIETGTVRAWCGILKRFTHLRTLVMVGTKTADLALGSGADPQAIYEELQGTLYERFMPLRKDRLQSMGEFVGTFPGGLDELLQPQRKSVALLTGFEQFDKLTDGFHEAEIFMIGAAPGMGKTAFLCNLAVNIGRRGSTVAIFELEMSRRSLFNRIICGAAGISVNRFRRGGMDSDERLRIVQATDFASKLPLAVDPSSALKVPDMAMKLKQLNEKQPVALAAIDFIQLMKSSSGRHNENEKLTEIAQGIQEVAKTTGIPFLVLSQLSRPDSKAKKQRPGLHSLRGSGTLEQVSNVVAFLWREDADESLGEGRGDAELIISKNREGGTGTIKYSFVRELMRFEEPT